MTIQNSKIANKDPFSPPAFILQETLHKGAWMEGEYEEHGRGRALLRTEGVQLERDQGCVLPFGVY